MDEIRPTSWAELQDALFIGAWRDDLLRYRSPYAFRGMHDAGFGLATSLARLGGDFKQMERHLLRNFRKYARHDSVEHDSIWDWLALAKHHGLPTRLLDWSFSLFVAMHFATADIREFERDGVIWLADYRAIHRHLPEPLTRVLQHEGSDVLTIEMLSGVTRRLGEFDGLAPEPFVVFFEPPSIDARIVNQFALFSLMSDACADLGEWLGRHPDVHRRIVVPASLKWEIRDKLDQANITERVLFPGLDGLSAWLNRQYTSRAR